MEGEGDRVLQLWILGDPRLVERVVRCTIGEEQERSRRGRGEEEERRRRGGGRPSCRGGAGVPMV